MNEQIELDEALKLKQQWERRPRTAAWARRYDVDVDAVKAYIDERVDRFEKDKAHEQYVRAAMLRQDRRIRRLTRIAAAVVLLALVGSGFVIGYAWQEAGVARHAEAKAAVTKTIADVAVLKAQNARLESQAYAARVSSQIAQMRTNALQQINQAKAQANAAQAEAVAAQSQANVAQSQAGKMRTVAQSALKQANVARTQADRHAAESYLQAGRQAFFDGDIDDAAVALAAAYTHDPSNEAVRTLLPQTLDALNLRGDSVQVSRDLITSFDINRSGVSAAGDVRGNVRLVDAAHHVHPLPGFNAPVTALTFDHSGNWLIAGALDGSVRFTNIHTGRSRIVRAHSGRVNAIAAGGVSVASAASDTVKVWTPSGDLLSTIGSSSDPASANDITFDRYFAGETLTIATDTQVEFFRLLHGGGTSDKPSAYSANPDKTPAVHICAINDSAVEVLSDGRVSFADVEGLGNNASPAGALRYSAVVASPDRYHVALAASDGSVRVLDASTHEDTARLTSGETGTGPALTVRYSPDGRYIAAGYQNGRVAVWKTAGYQRVASLMRHKGEVSAIHFTSDGASFETAGADGALAYWKLPTMLARVPGSQQRGITKIVHRGELFAAASQDGSTTLWRSTDGLHFVRRLPGYSSAWWATGAEFSADGQQIVVASGDSVALWTTDGHLITRRFAGVGRRLSDAAMLPHGEGFVVAQRNRSGTASQTNSDKWWTFSSSGKGGIHQGGYQKDIQTVQVDEQGRYVLAASPHYSLVTLTWLDGKRDEQIVHDAAIAQLVPRAPYYLIGSPEGSLRSVSVTDGRVVSQTATADARVDAMTVNDSGSLVAWSISGSDAVQVRALSTRGEIAPSAGIAAELRTNGAEVHSLEFDRPAGLILGVLADGSVRVWDTKTGDAVEDIAAPGRVTAAAFEDDLGGVVLGNDTGAIYQYRTPRALGAVHSVTARVLRAVRRENIGDSATLQQAWRDVESER